MAGLRVPSGTSRIGWVLVRSLDLDGVTPATSMSLTDSIEGGSHAATLNATTGWSAVSGGMRFQPGASVNTDLDVDLDDLLGASWQYAGVMALWNLTIGTLSGSAAAVLALVNGGADVWLSHSSSGWVINNPGSSASGSATATSQRVLAMHLDSTGGTFYRSQTANEVPAGLTRLGQGTYARNATSALSGLELRLGLAEPGSTMSVTLHRLDVYARYGL